MWLKAVYTSDSRLLHKKGLYWELWLSSCASTKLDFPLPGITLLVPLNKIGQHLEKSIRFGKRVDLSQVGSELCEHKNLRKEISDECSADRKADAGMQILLDIRGALW